MLFIPSEEYPTIVWTGYGRKVPVVVFKADAIVSKKPEFKAIGGEFLINTYVYVPLPSWCLSKRKKLDIKTKVCVSH